MTNEWSVEKTEDIQEVDEKKKPASDAAFERTDKASERQHLPGEEKGAGGEYEHEPDEDKEAAP